MRPYNFNFTLMEMMMTETVFILGLLIYKLACLAVGSLLCYFGYRLFQEGIWGHAENLEANFRDTNLVVKSAAPGTFFVLLGAIIIVATILQNQKVNIHHDDEPNAAVSAALSPESGGTSK